MKLICLRARLKFSHLGFCLIFILFSSSLNAQDDSTRVTDSTNALVLRLDTSRVVIDSVPYYRINGRYLKSYWTSFKGVFTAPGRWDGNDWKEFGIVAGTAGIMFAGLDKPVRRFFQANLTTFTDGVEDVFYPLGNRVPPLLLTGMYVAAVVTKNRRLEHNSLMIAKSLALSTIVYMTTKAVIRRERPYRTTNSHKFTTPFKKNDYTSFPSGHSNTAFSVATGFAMQYKHIKWVPWVAYGLASLTSLSRIYQDRHWASDVIIGAAIGHYVTKTVLTLENKKKFYKKVVL